jgi:hypothetical protein
MPAVVFARLCDKKPELAVTVQVRRRARGDWQPCSELVAAAPGSDSVGSCVPRPLQQESAFDWMRPRSPPCRRHHGRPRERRRSIRFRRRGRGNRSQTARRCRRFTSIHSSCRGDRIR